MAKNTGFKKRFPHTTIFFVIAIAIAIPLTVWSLNNVSTNLSQEAAIGGKQSGSSSLSLMMVNDNNRNGLPNYRDTITFNVITTQTDYPYVNVVCYQNSKLVYSASAGFYNSYPWPGTRNIPLYSPNWTSGGADCTATLYNASQPKKPYVNLDFYVSP